MRCGFEVTSSERPTGCQKRRSTSPKGVPDPTRVSISCSSRDSMCFLRHGPSNEAAPENNTAPAPAARALREDVIALMKGAWRHVIEGGDENWDCRGWPLRVDIDF